MMRMPQTSTYIRRSYVRGLAFSIDMEHQKERYRAQKRGSRHVLSCEELKARLAEAGLLAQPEGGDAMSKIS